MSPFIPRPSSAREEDYPPANQFHDRYPSSFVGLGPLCEDDAKKSLQSTKVGGVEGHTLDVAGPEQPGKPAKRLVTVTVIRGKTAWFFSMSGNPKAVGEQLPAFQDFLGSVRFDDQQGK